MAGRALAGLGKERYNAVPTKEREMNQKSSQFELTGIRSLFMHADDVLAADALQRARKAPGKKGTAGDDRDPSWSWKTYLYSDGQHLCMPSLALMTMLRKGGVEFKTQGKKTLKAESQASVMFDAEYIPLLTHKGKLVATKDLDAIDNDAPFDDHSAAAEKLGFVLDVRRAKVGTSKHVRVRPKFLPGWQLKCAAIVDIDRISIAVFEQLLIYCGNYVGLGDWRPSAPQSPGQHGRFTVVML